MQNEEEFVHSIQDVAGAMCQALATQNENAVKTQVIRSLYITNQPDVSSSFLVRTLQEIIINLT